MKLDCFVFDGVDIDIRPASSKREWMDATDERFAYRCLPLSMANAHGWVIRCKSGFEAEWNGGTGGQDVQVFAPGQEQTEARGHFGYGILTFSPQAMFRTEPGHNLWVAGPPNSFKDGIQGLSAVVETDWMPYSFSMNWKFTRPNHRIRFERGEPYCFLFPVQRGLVEAMQPRLKQLHQDPESKKQVDYAKGMRLFLQGLMDIKAREGKSVRLERNEERELKFQKWYMRGEMPDGSGVFEEHQNTLQLRPFQDLRGDET